MNTIDFLGAAGTVTGSRFLVTTGHQRLLLDCGLFQGLRELRQRNWDPFPVPPEEITAIVVSHAHLDHSGYLPALVRDGFAGDIYATRNTVRLAGIVLEDSAHLLMEDAEHARTHGYSKHCDPQPLYTDKDVAGALELFQAVEYGATFEAVEGVAVTLRTAGHILGSATVSAMLSGAQRRLLFSGDLGRPWHPLLRPPSPPPQADVVVVESTYGGRHHAPSDDGGALASVINRTVGRSGSVVIPAFAVDRTEVILMVLRTLRLSGAIEDVPIYVDSPMALRALDVYRDAIRSHDPELKPSLDAAGNLFDPGNVHELRTVEESKSINNPRSPCIIVSASGMASGGRVLHHLAGLLPHKENTVILAGYQAVGTRGRALIEGAPALKIHGRYVPVRAEVADIPIFSVHADEEEIIGWLGLMPASPEACYVVHGEPEAANALSIRIRRELGWTAVVPRPGERVRLD